MPLQVINPVADLLQGQLLATSIAHQIRRAAQDQEIMRRQEIDRAREQQMQDIQFRGSMMDRSRPVTGGTVDDTETVNLPTLSGKFGATLPSSMDVPVKRKADRSRTVKYTDREGTVSEYELMTPQEQASLLANRLVAGKMLEANVGIYKAAGEARAQEAAKEPGRSKDRANRLKVAETSANARTADRTSRETVAEANRKAQNERSAASDASRERVAGIRARASGGKAGKGAEKVHQARREALQAKHDAAYSEENKAWASYESKKREIEEVDKLLKDPEDSTQKRQLEARRARLLGDAKAAKALAESKGKEKGDYLERKNAIGGGTEAGIPKNPWRK